jgi:hypothetical protein
VPEVIEEVSVPEVIEEVSVPEVVVEPIKTKTRVVFNARN